MIALPDGTMIQINEVVDEQYDTNKLQIEFSKEFIQSDITVSVNINGDILDLKSGNHEVGFKITKKF